MYGIGQQGEIAVHVSIDEAGDDVTTGHVDDTHGFDSVEFADRGDHLIEQRDVARTGGPPVPSITHPPLRMRSNVIAMDPT